MPLDPRDSALALRFGNYDWRKKGKLRVGILLLFEDKPSRKLRIGILLCQEKRSWKGSLFAHC